MTDKLDLIGKQFPVLDQGWVELVDYMPHPSTDVSGDLAIVNAARVSFLGESKGAEADKKLLMYLLREKHTSPFEMCVYKIRINAPLITWWQWVRHRMASYNFQSGRYTEFGEDQFYTPADNQWRRQSSSNKQASEGFIGEETGIRLTAQLEHYYALGYSLYKKAIEDGVAREQARLFLPGFSVYYTAIVKMDLHNLLHFLTLRMHPHAQEEIRVYANTIYNEIVKVMNPWTCEAYEKFVLHTQES